MAKTEKVKKVEKSEAEVWQYAQSYPVHKATYKWNGKKVSLTTFIDKVFKERRGMCYIDYNASHVLAYQYIDYLKMNVKNLSEEDYDVIEAYNKYSILGYRSYPYDIRIINGSVEGDFLKLIVRANSDLKTSLKTVLVPKNWSVKDIREYAITTVENLYEDENNLYISIKNDEIEHRENLREEIKDLRVSFRARKDIDEILHTIELGAIVIFATLWMVKFW